jgi:hypothetical protein
MVEVDLLMKKKPNTFRDAWKKVEICGDHGGGRVIDSLRAGWYTTAVRETTIGW